MKNTWKNISSFEFWPSYIFYAPFFLVWLVYSFRLRSFLYFSPINKHVAFGGLFRYSKYDMIKNLNQNNVVFTKFYTQKPLNSLFYQEYFNFPFIVKPDIGERGKDVHLVRNIEHWENIFPNLNSPFILQKYAPSKIELGVLYYRYPSGKSNISSIVIKEFLSVKGDGINTLKKLVESNFRANKRKIYFENKFKKLWLSIIPDQEIVLLEEIGNHSRGTVFKNGNYLINQKLINVFDQIVSKDTNFYYGRFDLKVDSIEDMYEGKGIQIFELNGVNSEPGHIYDPENTLIKAYKDVFKHYQIVYQIAKELKIKNLKPNENIFLFLKSLKLHFFK